jgi:hypothetical protein
MEIRWCLATGVQEGDDVTFALCHPCWQAQRYNATSTIEESVTAMRIVYRGSSMVLQLMCAHTHNRSSLML